MREMKESGHNERSTAPKVTCEVFEDNEGVIELARFPKMISRTNHINQMHYHFRSYVSGGDSETFPIDTKVQIRCVHRTSTEGTVS